MIPFGAPSPTFRRLVLWRHGRTEWNLVGRAQGHADVPLDAVGQAQARRAANLLATYEPAFVWSSDLRRARETAEELVRRLPVELTLDARLREYDVGARQGMTQDEFRAAYPEIFDRHMNGEGLAQIPGAEGIEQVRERMLEVLHDATEAVPDAQTGVLVGHGAALRTGILAFFDGRTAAAQPRGPAQQDTCGHAEMLAGMANCAWTVLEKHAIHGWQIVDYNATNLPEHVSLDDSPIPR